MSTTTQYDITLLIRDIQEKKTSAEVMALAQELHESTELTHGQRHIVDLYLSRYSPNSLDLTGVLTVDALIQRLTQLKLLTPMSGDAIVALEGVHDEVLAIQDCYVEPASGFIVLSQTKKVRIKDESESVQNKTG